MQSSVVRLVSWSCVVVASVCLLACAAKPVKNDPTATVPYQSNPIWKNWSQDLVHMPSRSGEDYYFSPTTQDELRKIVSLAVGSGVQLRVSGSATPSRRWSSTTTANRNPTKPRPG